MQRGEESRRSEELVEWRADDENERRREDDDDEEMKRNI